MPASWQARRRRRPRPGRVGDPTRPRDEYRPGRLEGSSSGGRSPTASTRNPSSASSAPPAGRGSTGLLDEPPAPPRVPLHHHPATGRSCAGPPSMHGARVEGHLVGHASTPPSAPALILTWPQRPAGLPPSDRRRCATRFPPGMRASLHRTRSRRDPVGHSVKAVHHPALDPVAAPRHVQVPCEVHSLCTVIRPSVRVPVLSDASTETEPRVSTAGSHRTRRNAGPCGAPPWPAPPTRRPAETRDGRHAQTDGEDQRVRGTLSPDDAESTRTSAKADVTATSCRDSRDSRRCRGVGGVGPGYQRGDTSQAAVRSGRGARCLGPW